MNQTGVNSPLSNYRVIDVSNEIGYLCGKILGDLGADVIKIERPGGDSGRNFGPFYHDIVKPEKSLYWFAYNSNKRGITLDIETPSGQNIFKDLVKKADFVIESFTPGYMKKLGLDYKSLRKINPRIVMASISPFGQKGPYKNFKASDITCMAMSGLMSVCGDPDRPPVRISSPQAYLHGGVQAAAGMMIAHYYRQATGEGQYVDVSIQHAMLLELQSIPHFWDLNKIKVTRHGPLRERPFTGAIHRFIWPCADGYVVFSIIGGRFGAASMNRMVQWMEDDGSADETLRNMVWEEFDWAKMYPELVKKIEEPISKFFLKYKKDYLYEESFKRRVQLAPVSTTKDLHENSQLAARDFWVKLNHDELGTDITYPGSFARASETTPQLRFRAPLIGEHNEDIYIKELGLSKEELVALIKANII